MCQIIQVEEEINLALKAFCTPALVDIEVRRIWLIKQNQETNVTKDRDEQVVSIKNRVMQLKLEDKIL
jgi:hypothetical protein